MMISALARSARCQLLWVAPLIGPPPPPPGAPSTWIRSASAYWRPPSGNLHRPLPNTHVVSSYRYIHSESDLEDTGANFEELSITKESLEALGAEEVGGGRVVSPDETCSLLFGMRVLQLKKNRPPPLDLYPTFRAFPLKVGAIAGGVGMGYSIMALPGRGETVVEAADDAAIVVGQCLLPQFIQLQIPLVTASVVQEEELYMERYNKCLGQHYLERCMREQHGLQAVEYDSIQDFLLVCTVDKGATTRIMWGSKPDEDKKDYTWRGMTGRFVIIEVKS